MHVWTEPQPQALWKIWGEKTERLLSELLTTTYECAKKGGKRAKVFSYFADRAMTKQRGTTSATDL